MFYTLNIKYITKVGITSNIITLLKRNIYNYLSLFKNSKYIKLLLLGDKREVDKKYLNAFRSIGISHLFAISGMHVTFLTSIMLKLLKDLKIKEENRYKIVTIILFLYTLIIGNSPSIIRAFLFFTLLSINKIYYLFIDTKNIFILALSITLLINPFFIYDIGFIYSFLISLTLIISSTLINKYNNYFIKLFVTSILSTLVSIPVTLYNFYEINYLTVIYNLIYVPFVTLIVFPLSLLILLFPCIEPLYNIVIFILEKSTLFLSNINTYLIFGKLNIIYYLLYILLVFLFIKYQKKIIIIIYLLLLIIHNNYFNYIKESYIVMLNVGQGDSFLIRSNNKTMLIDTGGIPNYYSNKEEYKITNNITIPYLKSKGIKKIDKLILTHGDYDHIGETINILNNYKVKEVFINQNKLNYLERKINKIHKVKVLKEGDNFNIGEISFIELNKKFNDENTSSIVLLGIYKNINILFTGDANYNTEDYILNNYNLPKIDILKLGHHGSKTSTKEELIKRINPKIILISVGKNNKFNHPNKETLNRIKGRKIYRTDKDGTVEISLNKR